MSPKSPDRHFTATTFIVEDGRVLFLEHKKLGTWLPPGGHIEKNELPHETALREIAEETGLEAELVMESGHEQHRQVLKNDSRASIVPRPWKILLEKIEENHEHIDLIYLARAKGKKEPSGEGHKFKWFSEKELEESEHVIPNAKYLGKLAIRELAGKG